GDGLPGSAWCQGPCVVPSLLIRGSRRARYEALEIDRTLSRREVVLNQYTNEPCPIRGIAYRVPSRERYSCVHTEVPETPYGHSGPRLDPDARQHQRPHRSRG